MKIIKFSSIQRRAERFKILTYKKVIGGELPPIEGFKVRTTRAGVEAVLPHSPGWAPKWVKDLRLWSFHDKCMLF